MKILPSIDKPMAIYITIIVVAGLVPLTWYTPPYTLIMGDNSTYWFNSPATFPNDLNMWMNSNAFGRISTYPTLSALFAPMYILQELGLANGLIQVILMSTLLICSGLTMFLFLSSLLQKKNAAVFLGSLFYMFCITFLVDFFSLVISWAHAFLPLILALFIRLIRERVKGEASGKSLVCFLFAFSFFMSFLTDNPPMLVIGLLSCFIVFSYLCITENILKVTIESLKISGLTIITSLWWIIPFILATIQIVSVPGQSITSGFNFEQALGTSSYRSSILNILWFNPHYWNPVYNAQYYYNPLIILTTFIPVIIAATGLLFKNQNKKMQYLFISIILLAVAITAGSHPPFGQLSAFLNKQLPLFSMLFRAPQSKFEVLIALFIAPLIACSLDSILTAIKQKQVSCTKYKKYNRKILAIFIVMIFTISTFLSVGPLFSGGIIEIRNPAVPVMYSAYVNVPTYWNEANQFFINDSTDYRILVTPDSPGLYMGYSWGYWGSDGVPLRLIQKPVIYNTYGYQHKAGDSAINMTYQTLGNHSYSEFNNLLCALNIKYILQRNDIVVNFTFPEAVNSTVMKNDLLNDEALEYVRSFGELDVYEYKNWNTTHMLTSTEPFEDNAAALTSFSAPNNEAVQLSYQQISASEYNLHINASRPFFLFFSEAYDSQWKLTEVEASWYSIPFSQDVSVNHTSAYGFSNMWYINKTGSYELKIYYTPESYFAYGIIISVLSLGLITACIGLHFYTSSPKKRPTI